MRKKGYFISLLFFVFVECNTVTQIKMNSDANVSENTIDYITFQYPKKLIVVNALVENKKDSSTFIYDTGAFYSKIEKNLANNLELPTIFTKDNSTAQGITRKVEMTSINKIKLSKTFFKNIAAGKLVYDKKSYSPCVAGDGIIGANLIKLQNWKVDFKKQRLYFSSQPFQGNFINKENTFEFTTSFLSGIPEIDIKIQGKTVSNVLFDVGFNGGLVLPKKIAKEFTSNEELIFIDQSTSGIFGSNLDTLLVKKLPVNLAGKSHNMLVEFSSLNKALIGNDFLEHFDVYLNYNEEKITLVQKSEVLIDEPAKFIPGILNDSLWVVNRTTPDLPYKIGDTLRAINGKKPKDLFKNHCDYFFNITKLIKNDSSLVESYGK